MLKTNWKKGDIVDFMVQFSDDYSYPLRAVILSTPEEKGQTDGYEVQVTFSMNDDEVGEQYFLCRNEMLVPEASRFNLIDNDSSNDNTEECCELDTYVSLEKVHDFIIKEMDKYYGNDIIELRWHDKEDKINPSLLYTFLRRLDKFVKE